LLHCWQVRVPTHDILPVLGHLAAASHVYRLQLADVRPWVERLSEDYGPAAVLVQSLAVADGQDNSFSGPYATSNRPP